MAARRRVVVLVCDGLGVGAAPDAEAYGDAGSDTLGHALATHPTPLPNLERLGLLALVGRGSESGARGRLRELSAGKDTTTGHWEMMGLVTERPFPLYPDGFPDEIVLPFEAYAGKRVLGNKAASGTEILKELGPEHQATGRPILYTSGDSVFQVACHEDLWPPERLWDLCRHARRLLTGDHNVGRVIARPFTGGPGAYARTANRRDFTVAPTGETWLDRLVAAGRHVFGVGKIVDIFSGRGISDSVHTGSDAEGMREDRGGPRRRTGGLHLHQSRRLRQQVRPSQRSRGIRAEPRVARRAPAGTPRGPRSRRSVPPDRGPRLRDDRRVDGPHARARPLSRRRRRGDG